MELEGKLATARKIGEMKNSNVSQVNDKNKEQQEGKEEEKKEEKKWFIFWYFFNLTNPFFIRYQLMLVC